MDNFFIILISITYKKLFLNVETVVITVKYFFLLILSLGFILLKARWDLIVLILKGENRSRINIVRMIIAKPKSLPGIMLYKKITALNRGLYKIVLYNSVI